MFRFLRKIIWIFGLFLALKLFAPQLGLKIGSWISGTQDSRVVQAFSDMFGTFSEGVGEAVEVFCDGLQEG